MVKPAITLYIRAHVYACVRMCMCACVRVCAYTIESNLYYEQANNHPNPSSLGNPCVCVFVGVRVCVYTYACLCVFVGNIFMNMAQYTSVVYFCLFV